MLEFEPGLFIWTTVSFLLLVVLLYKIGLPPILAFLAERERQIADQLATAAENQKRSEQVLAEHKKELAAVHQKAELILSESRAEGRRAKDEIVAKANSEADRVIARAKIDLEREKKEVMSQAKQEIVGLVTAAAGKVLRQKLTADQDRAMIEKSLREVRG
ncbi:MAG: F0F1 ATP synthase subunit B [Candidatus Margulisiibacteriota bacterium]